MLTTSAPCATLFMPALSQHEALVYQHQPAETTTLVLPLAEAEARRAPCTPLKCHPWAGKPGTRRDRWV